MIKFTKGRIDFKYLLRQLHLTRGYAARFIALAHPNAICANHQHFIHKTTSIIVLSVKNTSDFICFRSYRIPPRVGGFPSCARKGASAGVEGRV